MRIDTYVSDIKVLDYESVSMIQQIFFNFLLEPMHEKIIYTGFQEFLAFFFDFVWFYVETNKEPPFCHALTISFSRDISELLWFNIFFPKMRKEAYLCPQQVMTENREMCHLLTSLESKMVLLWFVSVTSSIKIDFYVGSISP